MIATTDGRHMKKHASKLGHNTPFHAEAERVRLINLQTMSGFQHVEYAAAMAYHRQWQRKHSYTARRKRFEAAHAALQATIVPEREHPPVGIWKRALERDDIRAYGAKRTGIVDIADHVHGLWWYQLSEKDRFALVELSEPVLADEQIFKIGTKADIKADKNRRNGEQTTPIG